MSLTWDSDVSPELRQALEDRGFADLPGALTAPLDEELSKPGLKHRQRGLIRLAGVTQGLADVFVKRFGPEPEDYRADRVKRQRRDLGPAGNEFANIQAIRDAGVPTMAPLAFGERFEAGLPLEGVLLISRVPGEKLEVGMEGFLDRCRRDPDTLKQFNRSLLDLVRTFHGAGWVHRDLYNCHLFLHEQGGSLSLRLIDLGRAFQPTWRKRRWRVKDLAQLKYSMPADWNDRFWRGFLQRYLDGAGGARLAWWSAAIDAKVALIARRDRRKTRPIKEPS